MIYLAQPYSHPDPKMMDIRAKLGMRACAFLFNQGKDVYAPIVHWHEVAKKHKLATDAATWQQHNFHMLDLAKSIYFLTCQGWTESVGLRGEFEFANQHNISMWLMDLTVVGQYNIYYVTLNYIAEKLYGKNNSQRGAERANLTVAEKR